MGRTRAQVTADGYNGDMPGRDPTLDATPARGRDAIRGHTPESRTRALARSLSAVLAAVAVVALAACTPTSTTSAIAQQGGDAEPVPGYEGVAVDGTPRVPRATFTDTEGDRVDLRTEMRRRPTLLYFGYTHCPDICPVHMATLAQALGESTVTADDVNVVFVTADPQRDTTSVLGDYLDTFDPSFIGLRAPLPTVDRVLAALHLPEVVIERGASDAEGYTVGHPGQVLAFDRRGRARLQYPFGTRQSQWVEDLPKIARGDWPG